MKAFEYASPTSVEQALSALSGRDSSEALAGGTDLLSRLKDYISSPERVVYLKQVDGLSGISGDSKSAGLTIGGGTRLVEIIEHPESTTAYPALRQAALEVATPQIRNMATLAGNLLQRPRCWYYRSGFGLLGGRRDDAGKLVRELEGEFTPTDYNEQDQGGNLVRKGDNRFHAIFMTDGDALFVSPSSIAPPLIALGAKATIVGPDGERTIPVAELYRVPKAEGERELTISKGEILTKVTIPPARGKNACYEVRHKQAHDWPLALAAVCVEMDGDKVSKANIILGNVAPIPYRSKPAEEAITGKAITRETAEAAAEAAVGEAKPLSMNAYRVPITRTAIKRALLACVGDRYWEGGA